MNTILTTTFFWLAGVGLGFIAVRDAPNGWRRALPRPLRKPVSRVLAGVLAGVGPHLLVWLLARTYGRVEAYQSSIDYLRYVAGGATSGVLLAVAFLAGCAVAGWAITATTWLYHTARRRVTR